MWNNDDELMDQKENSNRLEKLEQEIKEKEIENEEIKQDYLDYRRQFEFVQNNIQTLIKLKSKLVRIIRSTGAYILGRRNIKRLYSRPYKIKNASNRLKSYKYNLYDLGFVEKGLEDLEKLFQTSDDRYLRRAIAWELALWYANRYTKDGAYQALEYLQVASSGEKDKDQLRKLSIIQAECHERLDQRKAGQQIVHAQLRVQKHPDLYLAAANLEDSIDQRVKWMNQALADYQLQSITFLSNEAEITYDDLRTEPLNKTINEGPKVSIILPAFNFEKGIHIAIESILSQTWKNIELLVVDDCSTDDTIEVVKEYMEKDSRIKLFSTPKNSGPYIARNIALKEATGEYVTVNDADDWSHAEKIEVQVNHLIHNPAIIANTSEHARLTEDLKLYRRGTPGTYIFSNMSSLMFRREPVVDKLGFWDSVRFAADGEFKRRLIRVFGKQSIIDLKTGPLSLPRQSVSSLTGSSAFGYSGFFMGVRKEYVESLEYHHNRADSLYYPYPQEKRPFPVPEPMWPDRVEKPTGSRHFDVVIASDFQDSRKIQLLTKKEIEIHKEMKFRTGLVQMSCYNKAGRPKGLNQEIREIIDGNDTQMLVYGENITCNVLIVDQSSILIEKQNYIANIKPSLVQVIIDQPQVINNQTKIYDFRRSVRHLEEYFGKSGKWYPYNSQIREKLLTDHERELRFINLSIEQWTNNDKLDHELYKKRLDEWFIDDHPYTIK